MLRVQDQQVFAQQVLLPVALQELVHASPYLRHNKKPLQRVPLFDLHLVETVVCDLMDVAEGLPPVVLHLEQQILVVGQLHLRPVLAPLTLLA